MSTADFQVDLTNCDREPIHQLGTVQPHSYLIAFTADWTVSRASMNVAGLFGLPNAEALLGAHASEFLLPAAFQRLRTAMAQLHDGVPVERSFGTPLFQTSDQLFDTALHISGRAFVFEFETTLTDTIGDPGTMVRTMVARLDRAASLDEFHDEGAILVRQVIGFDRVMVYRFDRDGHGAVIGEALKAGVDSFRGLHYPASDIPRQARELYLRNPFRIIADVGASPVPIVPQLNELGEPLDLSLAVGRAVSPIHVEYLRNMGVGASLSISIIVEGKLWGLFACHHYGPRLPSFNARTLAELFGQLFSLKLETRLRGARSAQDRVAKTAGDKLLARIAGDPDAVSNPALFAELLRPIIPNDGVATMIDGEVVAIGSVPANAALHQIARRLNALESNQVYIYDRLADLLPEAADFAVDAAGMMAIPISRKPRDYVFLFRREQARTVSWAGEPGKVETGGEHGTRLSPRGSFAEWREEVRGAGEPFTPDEIYIGDSLRSVLTEVVLRLTDAAQEQLRQSGQRQLLLINELNHRVRNILGLIRGLVRQSRGSNQHVGDYIELLDGRITALARAHDQITRDNWTAAPLRVLIETEAMAFLGPSAGRLAVSGPEVLLNPEAYSSLALVIHELVTNSAKYGALSDSGTVAVSWKIERDGRLQIVWQESGGPPVREPARRGFGTTIIEQVIPHDLRGEARLEFHVTGLRALLTVPEKFIEAVEETPALQAFEPVTLPSGSTSAAAALPVSLLVVEDSLLIAMNLEETLHEIGIPEVKIASALDQAFSLIAAQHFDMAILDVNLVNETTLPLADRLLQQGTPFMFATGYGGEINLGDRYEGVTVINKPYSRSGVEAAIRNLFSAGQE